MTINDTYFEAELPEILAELQHQLALNQIPLLQKSKDSGDDIMVQCPYHGNGQERRPSAGIRKRDGLLHCFACGETHTLNEVISHCFGHYEDLIGSFGYKWLCKNFATVAVEDRKPIELNLSRRTKKEATSLDRQSNENPYVTEQELDKYRYYHPYWAKRGITDEWIIELFDLGYDRTSNCITMPVRDIDGNCLFVARRSVKTKWFNYPRSATKPLYGLYELSKFWKGEYNMNFEDEYGISHDIREIARPWVDEVIVCESMIDALTAWQYGKYTLAMSGLGTRLQFQQLSNLPCRKLILATDNDKAGMEARKRIRANVRNKIITEYLLPEGKKDLNDLTKEEFDNLQEVFS